MRSKTILLVDDDPDDREFFREAVTEIDDSLQCVLCSEGHHAFDILNGGEELPDLIFLDMNMPRMNGRQCLLELKKNENWRNIPVIIYTTSKVREDRYFTEANGAVHFITKPSRFGDLKTAIAQAIVRFIRHRDQ
jgi:CheY-like chemotaxis protein